MSRRHRSRSHALQPLPGGKFDTVIEWLLGLLLVFSPLAMGAVEAWSELVVVLLAAALGGVLAAKTLLSREQPFIWSWAYLPMGLFIALLAIQLIPLPASWVAAISPQTMRLKSQLLADLPNASVALKSTTLSFYPFATAHDLRLVLVASVVFVTVINVYRRPEQIKRLLIMVAVVGGAMAVLALMQDLSGAKQIFWSVYTGGKATSATFINYNNYSQFMNLSLGAALALLLIQQREIERGGNSGARSWGKTERQHRWLWWLGALLVAGVVSIFLSRSRMGVLSTLAGGLVAGVLIQFRRRKSRPGAAGGGWILAPIALAIFVAILWAGFDQVYDRLATLNKLEQTDGGSRWQTLQDLPTIWKQYPLVGIGSGAHETFYPMYDTHGDRYRTAHVEDDYAQVLEETGWVGAGLVLFFMFFIFAGLLRALRAKSNWTRLVPIGLSFGLLAVLIHSVSDFGQRLPAVAVLSALTCGLLVALGRMARQAEQLARITVQGSDEVQPASHERTEPTGPPEPTEPPQPPEPAIRPTRPFLLLPRLLGAGAGVLLLGWAVLGAARSTAAESYWNQASSTEAWLEQNGWEGSADDFARLIDNATAAADLDPANAIYRHRAIVYRWRKIASERDPDNGAVLLSKLDLDDTRQIIQDLHAARLLCPTLGSNQSMAGQLERFVFNDPAGAMHIRQGYRLSPGDPVTCFAAGLLDAVEGKWDDSLAKFKTLDASMFSDIVETYVHQVNRPDLALAVAGDDPERLMKLAGILQALPDETEADQKLKEMAEAAKQDAFARIKAKANEPHAGPALFAQMGYISADEDDQNAAITYFRRALASDYGNVGWRLGLARSLKNIGEVQQALAETRICLRLRPQDGAARRLIQELSVMPGALATENATRP